MEKEQDVGAAMAESTTKDSTACKKRARSFAHLSKVLINKLNARRGHHPAAKNANGEQPPPTPSSSSAAASFLSGCMHPRTHSFASARRHCHDEDHADAALAVNFRSLRIGPTGAAAVAGVGDEGSSSPLDFYSDGGASEERNGVAPPPPSPPALMTTTSKAVVGGVAVVTFSAAPYEDFRRSMREMVDAAAAEPGVDWEFMEELLFCYLRLNDRAVHREILRAFTDTVAALRHRRRRRRRRAAAKSVGGRRTTRRREDGADSSDDDGDH